MDQPLLPRRIAWFVPWTWKRRWKIAAAGLLLMATAYPLSVGPTYRLAKEGWIDRLEFKIFYHPIAELVRHRTELIPVIEWYIGLFG